MFRLRCFCYAAVLFDCLFCTPFGNYLALLGLGRCFTTAFSFGTVGRNLPSRNSNQCRTLRYVLCAAPVLLLLLVQGLAGVTEAHYFTIALYLFSGIMGPEFWLNVVDLPILGKSLAWACCTAP